MEAPVIPSYVPMAFYAIVALCAAASLYILWETFSKVFDFGQRQLHVRKVKREQAEYERRMRAMGNAKGLAAGATISGGEAFGQQQAVDYKIQGQGNIFTLHCTRENPHSVCNGKPRNDCTNGR